jgi:TonB-like protein
MNAVMSAIAKGGPGAAIEAVKQWVFEPARRGSTAVPVRVTLPVRFSLGEEE